MQEPLESLDMNHDVDKIIAEIEARSYCIIPSVISPEKADEARAILEKPARSGSDRRIARRQNTARRRHRGQASRSSSS